MTNLTTNQQGSLTLSLTSWSLKNQSLSGFLLAIAGTFLFSIKPIIIKYAYELDLSSEQVITLRMLIALPIYMAVAVYQWNRKKERRKASISYCLPIAGLGFFSEIVIF